MNYHDYATKQIPVGLTKSDCVVILSRLNRSAWQDIQIGLAIIRQCGWENTAYYAEFREAEREHNLKDAS